MSNINKRSRSTSQVSDWITNDPGNRIIGYSATGTYSQTFSGGYCYFDFTSGASNTFVVSAMVGKPYIEVLLVGGGGGGGANSGGGGGGGVNITAIQAAILTYTVKVGTGGAAGGNNPGNGVMSSFYSTNTTNGCFLNAYGGGAAGCYQAQTPYNVHPMGSGGGQGYNSSGTPAYSTEISNFANGGGATGAGGVTSGGGGGGAGAAGGAGVSSGTGGTGGAGLIFSNWAPVATTYLGGGGGGGAYSSSAVAPGGGSGGTGQNSSTAAVAGTANTGNGGGGGYTGGGGSAGAAGGSGRVIVRFRI